MNKLEAHLQKLALEIYEEQLYMVKTAKALHSIDMQNLLTKTIFIDDLAKLFRVLKELSEAESVGGHSDAFVCWTLYQAVGYLVSIRFDFLKRVDIERMMPVLTVSEIYREHMEAFLLGVLNEALETNLKNMSQFYRRKDFKKVLHLIEKKTKQAYFFRDFNKKAIIAQKLSDVQLEHYQKVNKKLKSLSTFATNDVFTYNWDENDLEKMYVDSIIFSQKVQIVISLLNKTKYYSLEGDDYEN